MIRRAEVKTTMFGSLGYFQVPVFYTDELIDTSVYDLAYSSVHGGFLPYLFAGYFSDEQLKVWYFANARMHEDMRTAVRETIGRDTNYDYGQLMFSSSLLEKGELVITSLLMHSELPQAALGLLREVIKDEYFDQDFRVTKARF
jgi:hypothetical protein